MFLNPLILNFSFDDKVHAELGVNQESSVLSSSVKTAGNRKLSCLHALSVSWLLSLSRVHLWHREARGPQELQCGPGPASVSPHHPKSRPDFQEIWPLTITGRVRFTFNSLPSLRRR